MSEKTVSITIPSDLYTELMGVPSCHGEVVKKFHLDLAIGMFVSKEVSLARAAAFAGMTIVAFSDLLNNFGVPIVEYTEDTLANDLEFASCKSNT